VSFFVRSAILFNVRSSPRPLLAHSMSLPVLKRPISPMLPRMQVRLPGWDVMTGLVVVMVVIQFVLGRAGGVEAIPSFYRVFGLSWQGFSEGRIWQVVSHALIHANWFHLMLNLMMLWLVGGRVVHILGFKKWIQIVLAGVLGGGFFHLFSGVLMMRTGYPETHLVGVSGACVALLLVLTTLSPDSRMWPIPISGKNFGLGLIVTELILWLMHPGLGLPMFSKMGQQLVLGGIGGIFQISHACHLGGALAGWWMARRVLAPPPSLEELQRLRKDREGEQAGGKIH